MRKTLANRVLCGAHAAFFSGIRLAKKIRERFVEALPFPPAALAWLLVTLTPESLASGTGVGL